MDHYMQVEFRNLKSEQQEIIIALLNELGYEGFEEHEDHIKAYIVANDFDEEELNQLASTQNVSFSISKMDNRNWNQEWESGFKPVIIDDFVAVRADFHTPIPQVKHEIIITPKMSFGTGHHATTSMMIRTMGEIDFIGKNVLDFGTGTGILAILAGKLGAKRVVAIDNDDWSIANAAENLLNNHCHGIELLKGSTAEREEKSDIILANIIRAVIMENFHFFHKQLNYNGILLLSGLLEEDEQIIQKEAAKYGFVLHKKRIERQWLCLKLAI